MLKQEIIEGNKLIAEFMDISVYQPPMVENPNFYWKKLKEYYPHERIHEYKLSEIDEPEIIDGYPNYHSSWDLLMPVIDKIWSMNEYPSFVDHTSSMFNSGGIYIHIKLIENTWNDVVEFIKWYNLCQKEK